MADMILETRYGERVRDVARRIVRDAPRLGDLGAEELEKLARVVVAESLKDELRHAVDLQKIDYRAERTRFLGRASRTGSEHTCKAYRSALERLEAFCERQGIAVMELTPALADDWIESEKAQKRSSASVRLSVAGASAFFTFMERRNASVRNPFRGTRARPMSKAQRRLAVPSAEEITALEKAADSELRAAIVVMARLGLRVGALPSLTIYAGSYTASSKGKEITGPVTEDVRKAIERSGLPLRSPFASLTADKIRDRFRYLVRKLHGEGRVRDRYSVHDLRHAFAVKLYGETKDVYAIKTALSHASVAVTEAYLRSLEPAHSQARHDGDQEEQRDARK